MADKKARNGNPSTQAPRVTHPSFVHTESDPFERIVARLHGLELLTALAEGNGGSEEPVHDTSAIWHFMRMVHDDIHRDLYAMLDDRNDSAFRQGALGAQE